jgi:four helix bundle protein
VPECVATTGKTVPKELAVAFKTFREIVAWQRGNDLALRVYEVTKEMPPDERFGLTLQMRRAAVSVSSNIAEGFGRGTRPEFAKFCRISRGSLFELMTQIELAEQLEYLRHDEDLSLLLTETERLLQGLLRSLEQTDS